MRLTTDGVTEMDNLLGNSAYGLVITLIDLLLEKKAITPQGGQIVFAKAAEMLEQLATERKDFGTKASAEWLRTVAKA